MRTKAVMQICFNFYLYIFHDEDVFVNGWVDDISIKKVTISVTF